MNSLAICGPVGYRKFTLEEICETNEGHSHNYDHAMRQRRGLDVGKWRTTPAVELKSLGYRKEK